jgi:tape measure domain-containing protein
MTAASAIGVGKVIELSDSFTQASSRLDLVNDGLQTTAQLQDMIYRSAQSSRGDYLDNMATVSKLGLLAGDSFTSNEEMVDFVELMNKNFIIGGSSTTEQSAAMYQLTQAMAAGKLQGDEYRSIIENAPLLAGAIEDYMQNAGVEGTMKDWASEGLLTADVIKNALFSSADEIESRFENMPMTFGQIWTRVKNSALVEFQPILTRLNDIANSERFDKFVDAGIDAISNFADVALSVFEVIADIGAFMHDNWDAVGPIIYGIVAAYVAWEVATKAVAAAQALLASSMTGVLGLAIGVGLYTFAYTGLTNAIENATESENQFSDQLDITSQSSYVAAEKVKSLMMRYEELEDKVNKNQKEHDTMNNIVSELERTIPGLSSQIRTETGYVDNLSTALRTATDRFYDLARAQAYYNAYSEKLEIAVKERIEMQDQYDQKEKELDLAKKTEPAVAVPGRDGSNVVDYDHGLVDDLEEELKSKEKDLSDKDKGIDDIINNMGEWKEKADLYDDTYGGENNYPYPEIVDNVEDIKSALQDDLVEDIKYMKDMAERDSINRFTTAEVNVNLGGVTNTVNGNLDLDGIVDYITTSTAEQLSAVAESYNGEV